MWQIEAVGRRLRPDCGKDFPTVGSPAGIGEGAGSGKKYGIKIFPATKLCRECQGKCCQSMPGIYHPRDIKGPKRATIAKMLREGRAAIDCWEADPPIYYLRPIAGASKRIFDSSWGGPCQHLTPTGCALPEDKRPLGCLTLEPTSKECRNHIDKHDCACWWSDYQDMLIKLGETIERIGLPSCCKQGCYVSTSESQGGGDSG